MLLAAIAGLALALVLALFRGLAGPTLYDRMLAANAFGTKIVLLVAIAGFAMGRPAFLDVAIAYALINFIATIALLKVVRRRTLTASLAGLGAEGEAP